MATDWPVVFRSVAQEQIAEPVIAAGVFAPAGSMGSMGIGKISPLASMIADRSVNARSGGLGHHGAFKLRQALLAVTADKVYGFNSKNKGRSSWKIVDQVVVWERRDVRTTIQEQKITRAVTLEILSTGETYEFEMMNAAGSLNDSVLIELMREP